MTRVGVLAGFGVWLGATLLLSRVRWFARAPLADRLRPYVPGGFATERRSRLLSLDSFRDAIGPLCRQLGERISAALGVGEDLSVRLARIHAAPDVTAFRVRQVGWSLAAFGGAGLVTAASQPPLPLAALLLLGAAPLAYLTLEHMLSVSSRRWQRRLFLELPIVAEQLAMLLNAGYSLTAALNRLAARGHGSCARDLTRVCARIRQGLSENAALREWAGIAGVPAVDRLVAVLALNREASDLGRLLSDEARAIRRDVQRELVGLVERRSQQVWIPVTIATLIPGVIFLAVPFIEALRLFAG